MGWILATISKTETKNWEICKSVGLWGVSIQGENNYIPKAQEGDMLLFWLGGKGFVGHGVATEDLRPPHSESEVPWRGGSTRYGFVLPFRLNVEFEKPKLLSFRNNLQLETNIPLAYFRRGFQPITDEQANKVLNRK
jgi:hypothetical protein